MNWFLAGWTLALQAGFWGLGLTLLVLPRRWRRFWPAFAGPAGLALQSAVVWAGAHTALPGTDAYAYPALLLPVGLLAAAFWRFGARETGRLLTAARGWWVLLPILSVSLVLQSLPFTKPPARFTVRSLGSCDAADYAAGARVLKEFAPQDRTGFLGEPDQLRGLSVDNFYDFWLRINHFTPSALLALDSTLLRRQPYELTSLLGMVLVLLNLPVVFWLARSLFRFGPAAAAFVTLLYGCSPVLYYAVYQVALGQLLAAPAVGLVLWTCLQAERSKVQSTRSKEGSRLKVQGPGSVWRKLRGEWRPSGAMRSTRGAAAYLGGSRRFAQGDAWRPEVAIHPGASGATQRGGGRIWSYFGLLFIGNWLLLGGYNFFVVFAYVPVAALVGGRLLWRRRGWADAGRLAAFVGVNLLGCAVLFPERVISLAERFFLFHKTPFGWKIAAFRPEGWYGAFGDAYLRPGGAASLALGAACLLALGAAAWRLARGGGAGARAAGVAAACVLPILCGYGLLTWEEAAGFRKNASYDAYKLFTVFYPVVLPGLCLWLAAARRRAAPAWAGAVAAALAAGLLAANYLVVRLYDPILRVGAYTVGTGLSDLAWLEQTPGVGPVNIRLKTVWDALWANQFLLHKPQYFLVATYEGRQVTPLRGVQDLCDRYTAPLPPAGPDRLATDEEFALIDREGMYVETRLLNGWYEPERRERTHWCWAGPVATASVVNPRPEALDARLRLAVQCLRARRLRLFAGPTLLWEGTLGGPAARGPAYQECGPIPLRLPPGETLLRFESPDPPDRQPGDPRDLTFALYRLQVQLGTDALTTP